MKKILLAGIMLLGCFSLANATVINFDDLGDNSTDVFLSSRYGLTWGGGLGGDSWVVSSLSNPFSSVWGGFPVVSGTNYAWSNGAADLTISAGIFDFNSMWIRIGGAGLATNDVMVNGYSSGNLIYSQEITATLNYQLFNFDFLGVDNVTISNGHLDNLLIDDITVNAPPVPEPSTLALVGLGLAGAEFLRRKKRT